MRRHKRQGYCRLAAIIPAIVVGVFCVGGCNVESSPQGDPLAVGPDMERLGNRSEYADMAIRAAGGLDAWLRAREIELDCVVTFFQEDGTFYLTEQLYEIFPWSNSIRISGREPSGEYSWLLQRGRLSVSQGMGPYRGLSVGVDNGCIAEGILSVMTAPVRLLDDAVEFKWSSETVRVKGQLYKPIKRARRAGAPAAEGLRDAAFYQKESTARVDMILLGCGVGGGAVVVRGHDYQLLARDGLMVPSKIEAYKANASGRVRHRIIQIDVK